MIQSCKTKEEIMRLSENGQKAFSQMEASKKPIVAAIMGSCMGGGLEVRFCIKICTWIASLNF